MKESCGGFCSVSNCFSPSCSSVLEPDLWENCKLISSFLCSLIHYNADENVRLFTVGHYKQIVNGKFYQISKSQVRIKNSKHR